jgi:hypothetical protein
MVRRIVGAVVGIAIAIATVMLMEWLSHSIHPLPPGLDVNDSAAMNNYLDSVPPTAMLLVLIGYLVGTFDGTLVACLIGRVQPMFYALLIGVLMLAGTISTLIMFRHPTWFSIASIVGIAFFAWFGAKLFMMIEARRQATT